MKEARLKTTDGNGSRFESSSPSISDIFWLQICKSATTTRLHSISWHWVPTPSGCRKTCNQCLWHPLSLDPTQDIHIEWVTVIRAWNRSSMNPWLSDSMIIHEFMSILKTIDNSDQSYNFDLESTHGTSAMSVSIVGTHWFIFICLPCKRRQTQANASFDPCVQGQTKHCTKSLNIPQS